MDNSSQPNMGTAPMQTTPPPTTAVTPETPMVSPSAPATPPANPDPFNLNKKIGSADSSTGMSSSADPVAAGTSEPMGNIPEVKLPGTMPAEMKPAAPTADPMASNPQQG